MCNQHIMLDALEKEKRNGKGERAKGVGKIAWYQVWIITVIYHSPSISSPRSGAQHWHNSTAHTHDGRERCEHIEPFSIGYTRGELKLQNNTSADNETIHHRHLSYDELVIYFLNMISASSTTQTSSKQRTTAKHKSLLVNKPPTTPTTTSKKIGEICMMK